MTTTTLTPEQIPSTWCRMWNEDASLAHALITDDGRWWSGVQAGPDALVGPSATEALVAGYQDEVGTTFVPRTLVIDGADRLAYTWDATRRDGTVITGADVCVLRDGKVVRNWTIPGERQDLTADPLGSGVTTARAHELVEGWLRDRDGQCDPSVFVAAAAPDDGTYETHGGLVVDEALGTVAFLWSAQVAGQPIGGMDVLIVVDDQIARCWSFTGQRAHVLDGPRA